MKCLPPIVRHLLMVAALLGAPACSRDPTSPGACTSVVAVTVGRGLQPAITWQPACAASGVMVIPTGVQGAFPVWSASELVGSGLTPPVQVGTSPPGANVWAPGAALSAGSVYTVFVSHGGRGNPAGGTDSLTFIAQP